MHPGRILQVGPLGDLPAEILVRIWREASKAGARARRTLKHYILNAGLVSDLVYYSIILGPNHRRGYDLLHQRRRGWQALPTPPHDTGHSVARGTPTAHW